MPHSGLKSLGLGAARKVGAAAQGIGQAGLGLAKGVGEAVGSIGTTGRFGDIGRAQETGIGLQDIGASLQGRQGPGAALQQAEAQRRANLPTDLEEQNERLQLLKNAAQTIGEFPEGELRNAAIRQIIPGIEKQFQGGGLFLESLISNNKQQVLDALEDAIGEGDVIIDGFRRSGATTDEISEWVGSTQGIDYLERKRDLKNLPVVSEKVPQLLAWAEANEPEKAAEADTIPEVLALNRIAPEDIRLTPGEEGTFINFPIIGIDAGLKFSKAEEERQIADSREKAKSFSPKNVVTVDGRSGLTLDNGKTFIPPGATSPVPVPGGSKIVGLETTAAAADIFGKPRAKEVETLREQEIAVRGFLTLAKNTQNLFQDRPEVLSLPGDFARFGVALSSQAEGFGNLLGFDFTVIEDGQEKVATGSEVRSRVEQRVGETIDNTTRRFGVAAEDRARVRGAIVGLAFAAAASSGQTGKSVSDRDVERFTRRIGESASPAIFSAVLQDMQEEVISNFETRHKVLTRGLDDPPKLPDLRRELGIGLRKDALSLIDVADPDAILGMNRQELIARFEFEDLEILSEPQQAAIRLRMQQLGGQ